VTATGTAQRKSLSQQLLEICSETVLTELPPLLLKLCLLPVMSLCHPFCNNAFEIFLFLCSDDALKIVVTGV